MLKYLFYKNPISTILGILLFLLTMASSPFTFAADKMSDFSPSDIVAQMKPKLDLTDQQVKDLTAALGELGKNLHTLIANQESATEEEDPNEFIKNVKQAQADYQKKLKGILNDNQQKSYSDLREQAIMDLMKDLADIKLIDIQPHVGFSDDQLQKLIPVTAESMRGFIKIAWQYAGKRLRLGQKIRVARELKDIQHKAEKQVKQILTDDQYKKWEEYKEQQQKK
jgi:hypothetical protein